MGPNSNDRNRRSSESSAGGSGRIDGEDEENMKKFAIAIGVLAVAALLTTSFAANRGVDFTPLGIPEGAPGFFGTSMNWDGTKVGGSAGGFGAVGGCLSWDEFNGFTTYSYVSGVCYMSRDGEDFTADQQDELGYIHAAKWNGSELELLPDHDGAAPCDATVTTGYQISGDGSTVVGLAYSSCSAANAFVSNPTDGTYLLPRMRMDRSARANVTNYDGTVVGGWNDNVGRQGIVWRDGMPEWVHDSNADPSRRVGEVYGMNSDGTAMAGLGYSAVGYRNVGWAWTQSGGVVPTGALPGGGFFDAGANFAVNEDGTVVGGRFGFGPFSSATLWTPTTGIMNLNQFLIDQGRTEIFDGWFMVQVNAMSADGTKLLVFAANPGSGITAVESVIIDISKVSVCHANPSQARTLNVEWEGAMEHVAHGDFLGTCEAAGIGARAASAFEHFGVNPDNVRFREEVQQYSESHDPRRPVAPATMQQLIELGSDDAAERHVREHVGTRQR